MKQIDKGAFIKNTVLILLFALVLVGCVHKKVIPIKKEINLKSVCIEENVKVIVKDFLPTLRKTFHEHGIETYLYKGYDNGKCQYIVRYTALQSWDYVAYLSVAKIYLLDQELNQHGFAKYELILKGGYDFRKYKSVKSKIKPLISELLKNYHR